MPQIIDIARSYASATVEAITETLWPTRCAVCDTPGAVLCEHCRASLSYIDWWRACPRCGSPFGMTQCCECNDTMLALAQRAQPGYDGCASALLLDDAASSIVRTWKDGGERRLAEEIANIMAAYVLPEWKQQRPAIVPIPASTRALRNRGFDHGAELGAALARILGLPLAHALKHPNSADQRELGRRQRLSNMSMRFVAYDDACKLECALIADDVHTTGATLWAAADALHEAGVEWVWGITFARAW